MPLTYLLPVAAPITGVEHITYLYPSMDGYIIKISEGTQYLWESSDPVSIGLFEQESNGEGDVWDTTATVYVPDAPTPDNATGNYRLTLITNVHGIASGGAINNVAYSEVHAGGTSIISDPYYTTYQDSKGGWHPGLIFYERDLAFTDFNISHNNIERVYETGNDNEEGKSVWWKVDAYADNGTSRYNYSSVIMNSLVNETEYENPDYGWSAGCRDASNGDVVNTTDATRSTALRAQHSLDEGDNDTYTISRSFITFPMSGFGADRTVTSAILQLRAYFFSDGNAIIYSSTHGSTLLTSHFGNFDQAISSSFTWPNVETSNSKAFNSIGIGYVNSEMSTNGNVKICLREYDHDVLDSPPTGSQQVRNGIYFSEESAQGKRPRLEVVYYKEAEWTNKTNTSNWTAGFGTWNGSSWDSEQNGGGEGGGDEEVRLDNSGSWATGYRPVVLKLLFTGQATLYLEVNDGAGLFTSGNISSNEEKRLIWRGNPADASYDLTRISVVAGVGQTFQLTSIQFMEK